MMYLLILQLYSIAPEQRESPTVLATCTAGKYVTRQLPWYEHSASLDEETQYNLRSSSAAISRYAAAKCEDTQYHFYTKK